MVSLLNTLYACMLLVVPSLLRLLCLVQVYPGAGAGLDATGPSFSPLSVETMSERRNVSGCSFWLQRHVLDRFSRTAGPKDVTARERQGPRAGVAVKGGAGKRERGRNVVVTEMLNIGSHPREPFACKVGITARYKLQGITARYLIRGQRNATGSVSGQIRQSTVRLKVLAPIEPERFVSDVAQAQAEPVADLADAPVHGSG